MKNRKLYVESLGCPKNRVDTEVFLGTFAREGWGITDEPEEADLIIVNTCGFIEDARKESLERFFSLANVKNKNAKIVLAGCLPQLYPDIAKQLPEADFVTGIDITGQMARFVESHWGDKVSAVKENSDFIYSSAMQRTLTLSPFSSYIKIADGCDNCCSYCAIPLIRGSFRERTLADIEIEAQNLLNLGVKELVLIAQDTTNYGKKTGSSIEKLLKKLSSLGDVRLRLMYLYPSKITDELLKIIRDNTNIYPYFEIPVQHINDTVLEAMNRHYRRADVEKVLNRIDKYFGKKAVLRTSFITGFPAEKKEHFQELLDFIDESHFDYAGIFSYSKEERTKAAGIYKKLPAPTMEKRLAESKERASQSMEKRLGRFIGQKLEILFEEIEQGSMLCSGRGYHQAPEIDGVTILTNVENEKPGDFLNVKITARDGIDFIGEIIKKSGDNDV